MADIALITARFIKRVFNRRNSRRQERIVTFSQLATGKPPNAKTIGIIFTASVILVVADVEDAIRTGRMRSDPTKKVDNVIGAMVVLASRVKRVAAVVSLKLNKIVWNRVNVVN